MTEHDDRMPAHDPVARFLARRGVSARLRGRDLRGLVADWDALALRAERYSLTLDDWLNDLDLRDIIAGAMSVAPGHEREAARALLDRADDGFRQATVDAVRPLVADADRDDRWWYLRHPAKPGAVMRDDLIAEGLLARA